MVELREQPRLVDEAAHAGAESLRVALRFDDDRGGAGLARILDGGILLARLPKGQIGEETARLTGSFILALDRASGELRWRLGGKSSDFTMGERATFAWLFATGTPQEGLDAFLARRRPKWDC
mgnify:CR=1 FL=1